MALKGGAWEFFKNGVKGKSTRRWKDERGGIFEKKKVGGLVPAGGGAISTL